MTSTNDHPTLLELLDLPPDKRLHLLAGYSVAALAVPLGWLAGLRATERLMALALLAALLAGLLKELADRWANLRAHRAGQPAPHSVELLDAAATLAGGVAFVLPPVLLQVLRAWLP